MKLARPTVLLASIAITTALVAYHSRQLTLVCDGSDEPSANLRGSDPLSSHASIRHRTRETISSSGIKVKANRSSSAMRTVQGNALPPGSIASSRPQLETHNQHGTANHAVRQEPSERHRVREENVPQSMTGGQARKVSMKLGAVKENGPYHLPQPAVWADTGDLNPDLDLAIQQEAERLVEQIASSDLPADSDEYRELWNSAVTDSDLLFRARYGDWAWMVHHAQAHHLAAATQEDTP